MIDLKKTLQKSQGIAVEVGEYILSQIGNIKSLTFKGERNIVTEVDKAAEEKIKEYFKRQYPEFDFLGEEFGGECSSEYCWIVDPLDGTNNFSHTFPVFCVSIALMKNKKPLLGVVYDPNRKELFHALENSGSYLNNKKITVSKTKFLRDSLLATGFYYEFKSQFDTNVEHFINFLHEAQGIRRTGAAAIDCAWLAAGRVDGFWELGLKPWDTAAGMLLIKEAGGVATSLEGLEFDPFIPNIAASNGLIHQEMLRILALKKDAQRLF